MGSFCGGILRAVIAQESAHVGNGLQEGMAGLSLAGDSRGEDPGP